MNPLEFFRLPAAQHVLGRAARCAATPLSLHYFDNDQEGTRVAGWGQCAACRFVHHQTGGPLACRKSRTPGSSAAVKRGKPVPFVCHMGFVNVAMDALPQRLRGFVITFGPYVPCEDAGSLEHDAMEGLGALGLNSLNEAPFSLDDIHRAAPEAVPEIAAWTAETLCSLWDALLPDRPDLSDGSDESDGSDIFAGRKRRRRPHSTPNDPYHATAIAAAISSGALSQARALAQTALSEGGPGGRSAAARRARAVTIATAALEACEHARLNTARGWGRFHRVIAKLPRAKTSLELLEWLVGILGSLCRHSAQPAARAESMEALNRIVESRFAEGITLAQAALELGENATTITRRLQRNFGMSFSQYVGQLRIEKAKELLRRTKLSVSAIARRVGLSDVSNFSKLFRKFEGMSPQEHRKRNGGK